MKSAREFIRGPNFATSVLKWCAISVPSWMFIRESEADPSKKRKFSDREPDSESGGEFEYVSVAATLRGLTRGQKGYLEYARRLARRENHLVEFIIGRVDNARAVRLEIWTAVPAGLIYLDDRDIPYSRNLRR